MKRTHQKPIAWLAGYDEEPPSQPAMQRHLVATPKPKDSPLALDRGHAEYKSTRRAHR